MDRQRRARVFGSAVAQYESARPGYPPELVRDVLAFAGSGPVLEVGAGSGKASVAFAAHGVDLTCVEPDPAMAEVLVTKVPSAAVAVEPFESWRPDRAYRLLVCAQAWHWIDGGRRWDLGRAAVADGGVLALFWNKFAVVDESLFAGLAAVDGRHGLTHETPHSGDRAELAGGTPDFSALYAEADAAVPGGFGERTERRYRGTLRYATADYLDLLASISKYAVLPAEDRAAVLADTAAVVDAHGGGVHLSVVTDLVLLRRAGS